MKDGLRIHIKDVFSLEVYADSETSAEQTKWPMEWITKETVNGQCVDD